MLYELRVFYSHFPDKLSAFLAAHSFGFEHTMAVFAGAFFSASQWSEPLRTRSFRRSRRSSRTLHSLSLLWRRLPTSQFCHASRATHEAGSSSDAWHSSIRSPPITTPRSVEYSIGTPPGPTKSPCRSLKTKELIPPPDGGPERLTDTPTPYGCGKDRWSLDTGRKRSLSRHQKASSPCGCGFVIP